MCAIDSKEDPMETPLTRRSVLVVGTAIALAAATRAAAQAKEIVPQPGVENLGNVENFAVFQIIRREAEQLINGNK